MHLNQAWLWPAGAFPWLAERSSPLMWGPPHRARAAPQSLMPAGEAAPAVRCAALRCLVRVLATVDALPPSDSNLFTECAPPAQAHPWRRAVRPHLAGRCRYKGQRTAACPGRRGNTWLPAASISCVQHAPLSRAAWRGALGPHLERGGWGTGAGRAQVHPAVAVAAADGRRGGGARGVRARDRAARGRLAQRPAAPAARRGGAGGGGHGRVALAAGRLAGAPAPARACPLRPIVASRGERRV